MTVQLDRDVVGSDEEPDARAVDEVVVELDARCDGVAAVQARAAFGACARSATMDTVSAMMTALDRE